MASFPGTPRRVQRRGRKTPPPPIDQQPTKLLVLNLSIHTTFDDPEYAALYAELQRRDALPHWAAAPTTREA